MRSFRRLTRAAVLLAALAAGAGVARADLDVGMPPGTPLDWFVEVPRRTPTGSVRVPMPSVEKKAAAPVEGKTATRPDERPLDIVPSDIGQQTAMGYARILTVDIGTHIAWVNRRPNFELDAEPRPVSRTGGTAPRIGAPVEAAYPPPVSNDLFWLTSAVLLRKLIHPELVSSSESVSLLVLMGEPSLIACTSAEGEPALAGWIKSVKDEVKNIPETRPNALLGKDGEDTMLMRLAAEDLASGYPTGFDAEFCAHLLALEPWETAPLLIRYLDPAAHSLLRRNACAVLSNYSGEAVSAALLKALTQERDGVVRLRALDALVRAKDVNALAWLEGAAPAAGAARPLALYGLGMIGDPKSSKTLIAALAERENPDVLWAAVPAVARGRHEKPKDAVLALRKLAQFLEEAEKGTFQEIAKYANDRGTDETLLRVSCLMEMTVIALARLGEADQKKRLEALLDGEAVREVPGGSKIGKQAPLASKDTFGSLHSPSLVLLIESLPSLGEAGKKRLEVIVQDAACEVPLRIHALEALATMKALTVASCEKLLADDAKPMVRARALRLLATLDEGKAVERARKVVAAYDAVHAAKKDDGAEVIAALRVLLPRGKLAVSDLAEALACAVDAASAYRPPPPDKVLGDMTIHARPPVVEELLKALGASGDEAAWKPLLAHAQNKDAPARAAAVAALGGFFEKSRAPLVAFLEDEDWWVRLVAYRVLKRRAGGFSAFADWVWGARAERADAVKKWKAWIKDDSAREPDRKVEDVVDRALVAYAGRERDAAAWAKAKEPLRAAGLPALRRLLVVAGDAKKAPAAYGLLRLLTGETIPDDYEGWKEYLDAKK